MFRCCYNFSLHNLHCTVPIFLAGAISIHINFCTPTLVNKEIYWSFFQSFRGRGCRHLCVCPPLPDPLDPFPTSLLVFLSSVQQGGLAYEYLKGEGLELNKTTPKNNVHLPRNISYSNILPICTYFYKYFCK
jgi:hypothetical protein